MTTTKTTLPTNTRFGWFLTSVLTIASAYCYFILTKGVLFCIGLAAAALVCALLTTFSPKLLTPLNKIWMQFGELLGKIVSPLVLGIIFFLIITPTAMIGRAFGRDELKLRRKSQSSYWIDRKSPSPRGDSFNNQF